MNIHWLIVSAIFGKLPMLDCITGKLYMHKDTRPIKFFYAIFEQFHNYCTCCKCYVVKLSEALLLGRAGSF